MYDSVIIKDRNPDLGASQKSNRLFLDRQTNQPDQNHIFSGEGKCTKVCDIEISATNGSFTGIFCVCFQLALTWHK